MSGKKILMLAGDVTAPAWPAHPAWLSKFLEVIGTHIEHGAPVGA